MFAAVYFKGDGAFKTINCKKIKRMDGKTGMDLEIEGKVFVPYKTWTIDDAGRERDEDVDYEGVITFLDTGNVLSNIYYWLEVNYFILYFCCCILHCRKISVEIHQQKVPFYQYIRS